MERFKIISVKNISKLPTTNGVYSFWDKKEIIYIGKAVNVQGRVKNHKDFFMPKVDEIGYLETSSEIEALILEANLIKKYQPKFNVVWRDDKNYFFVAIAKGKLPYIYITHQKNEPAEYIGPFVQGTALKKTLKFLRHVFPYYTQAKHPKNKCTYCHLGLCPGPNPDLREYRRNIKKLILILQGKRSAVLNSLKKEMKNLSSENRFEEAGKIRDTISNLQQVMAHSNVIDNSNWTLRGASATKFQISNFRLSGRVECYDVSNIQGKQATGSMTVFVDGKPNKNEYRKFRIKMKDEPNDIAMLKEVLQRRFTHPEWKYPEVILIDGGKAQFNVAIKCKPAGIKVLSISKGGQELFIEGRSTPIPLKNLPQEVYNLIKQLDDEAHRFAVAYHKKIRSRELLH